jgi:hypothetical protein
MSRHGKSKKTISINTDSIKLNDIVLNETPQVKARCTNCTHGAKIIRINLESNNKEVKFICKHRNTVDYWCKHWEKAK